MAALGLQRPQHSYSQSPRMSQSQHAPQSQSQPESQSQSQSGAADKENYDSVSGGWIMSMKLENFMCHKNLEVEFIPRVNFITGQNGSGKSAILTGLVVAFGSRARGTQRATSMKGLIRNGCSHATIRVELCNRGGPRVLFYPYKPEIFGDKIVVEKRIDLHNSSKLLLKDARGHIVSSKKEDLEEIITHFNIDVSNPCLVMTQDKSRQFLHSNGPGDKYQFFLKATQLKQLMDKLEGIGGNVAECISGVKSVFRRLTHFKEALNELDRELKSISDREEDEAEVEQLKAQYIWARLYDIEELLQGKEAEEQRIQQEMEGCEAQMQADADAVLALVAEREENVQAMNVASEEYKRLQEEMENFKAEWRAAKEEHRRNQNLLAEIQTAKRELEGNINRSKEVVAELLRKAQEESQVNLSQRASDIEAKQRQMTELRAVIDGIHKEIHDTKAEHEEKDTEFCKLKKQLEECEKELNQVHGWIQRMHSNRRDTIVAFGGENVRKLMAMIEQRRREFSQPPIGPVGVHVKLATQKAEKWSKLVEVVLDKHLNSFLAASTADAQLLARMARSLSMPISVHTVDFNLPRIQPPAQDVPDHSLTTVLRVIECTHSAVHNALIDLAHVEAVVLVDTFQEGRQVAYDRRTARQIQEVLTLEGDRLSLSRGQEVSRPMPLRNVRPRLTRDRAAQLRSAQAEAAQLEQMLTALRVQVVEGKRDLEQVQRRRSQLERDAQRREMVLKGLHHEMRELRAEAAAEEEFAQVSMADLEVDIQNMMPELEEQQRQEKLHQDQVQAAKQALDEVEAKKPRLDGEIQQFERAQEVVERKLAESNTKRKELDQRLAQLEETKQRLEAHVAEVQSDKASLAENVAEVKRKAMEYCPEEEAWPQGTKRMRADKVERKLQRKMQSLEAQDEQDQLGSPEERQQRRTELERKKAEKQEAFLMVLARAKVTDSRVRRLKESLKHRNERVNQSCHYLAKQLNWEFMNQLHGKNFTGKVEVDYGEAKLHLEVNAGKGTVTDVRSMSGGEKSFTTLAFALALHALAEAPFRAMDEFDIFMDNVTRNMCLKQAVGFALESRSQWIFITPHDITDVQPVEGSVKKMLLQAPRGS